MTRTVLVIGIGPGNPEQITVQAIAAMNRADVIFVPDKGQQKQELARVRYEICDRYLDAGERRIVDYGVPTRAEVSEAIGYDTTVDNWHAAIADVYDGLLNDTLLDGQCGAFLVWGDPSLYDSVLRILDGLRDAGRATFNLEVIPGITSVQALAAAHRMPLNTIGQPVLVTTGRRLAEQDSLPADSVVVMLDGQQAYNSVSEPAEIFWGAYLGTADEITVAGRLEDVAAEIDRTRTAARARHGWIMDTYLLRPLPDDESDGDGH